MPCMSLPRSLWQIGGEEETYNSWESEVWVSSRLRFPVRGGSGPGI